MRTKIVVMSVFLLMMATTNAVLPVADGLVTHLDADSLGLSDGAPVAVWTDLSSLGNHAVQDTAGAQPTYIAGSAAFGSHASVRFDGTSDWMDMVDAINCDSFTLFIVGKLNAMSTTVDQYFISGQTGNPTALNNRLRIASYYHNANWAFRAGNCADYYDGPKNTDTHFFTLNSVSNAWVDGSAITGQVNTSTLTPALSLGAYMRVGGGGWLNGEIAEVVVYNRMLTNLEIADTNEYFRRKYKPTQAASNPSPTGDTVAVDAILSWDAPETYENATYNVYFGTTEPNFLVSAPYGLTQIGTAGQSATTATPVPSPMVNDSTYYWVVDTFEPNDVPILHPGAAWSFKTSPSDNVPVVTAGSDWITWLDNGTATQTVSGTVNDFSEGDVADSDIVWTIQEYPGGAPATAMQMIDRGGDDTLPDGETDGTLLRDWIGTDTRGTNLAGDPLTLTIAGLASGSYTLTTIHHDLHDQTGNFDIAVDGTTVATGVDITSGTESPITRHVETITSDGINPIAVVFDLNERPEDPNSFFLMNGLEIEDASSNVVKVDFGNNAANISPAYEGYIAAHENPDTFGPVYYALGSGYVSITPVWGQESAFASVTKTNTGLVSTADLTTSVVGTYTLRLTAADDTTGGNPIPQVGWDTLDVQVVDDACAAAQRDTANWTGFMNGDINEDCKVDIEDLADLATEWLLTNEATGPIEL